MRKIKAKLVKFRSENGFWKVDLDTAFIGKEYTIDLDTIRVESFFNMESTQHFDCEVVDAWDDTINKFNYFPTELLEFER